MTDEILETLNSFQALEPGWMNGEGVAPSAVGLSWLHEMLLAGITKYDLTDPLLSPTLDGGVQAEWHLHPWYVSAEFNLEERTASLHAANVETNEVEEFLVNINIPSDMGYISSFVRGCTP